MPSTMINMSGDIEDSNEGHKHKQLSSKNNKHFRHDVNKLEITDTLTRFHLIAASFQSLQAIVLFYVASKKTINRSVFTNFATDEDLGEDMYIRPNAELLGSLSVSYYTAIFIMLASSDHWLCVLPF